MATRLLHGDCLDVLRTLPDCSVDAVVTDPPAGIAFMGKAWDRDKGGRDLWIAWLAERLAECLRVLKPGGHAVVWALPRTSGWTHRALEDAGFDVRDCVHHLFGSGFPKSLDVGKAIDKAAGAERTEGAREWSGGQRGVGIMGENLGTQTLTKYDAPATPAAQQWDGWGTALKPAVEHWWLARKPLDSTVAGTVTRWGTGALNVAGCRVTATPEDVALQRRRTGGEMYVDDGRSIYGAGKRLPAGNPAGRWPADVVLSHNPTCDGVCSPGCAVAELDQQSGTLTSGNRPSGAHVGMGYMGSGEWEMPEVVGDSGGASRFFPTFKYQAKPSTREKSAGLDDRNAHPTVKPVELMRWLIRLVTQPGGTVLDPFAGSGSTLVAATLEGFDSIGVEYTAEYLPTIEGRVAWAEQQIENRLF